MGAVRATKKKSEFVFFLFLIPFLKKRQTKKNARKKKSPHFPKKSENRFLSSDIVYLASYSV